MIADNLSKTALSGRFFNPDEAVLFTKNSIILLNNWYNYHYEWKRGPIDANRL